jgi:DNA-binding NtrC family response regulator
MRERLSALLIHQQPEPLRSLRLALERQGVETARARSCQEAWRILSGADPPHLVFTDRALADGLWTDVLALAARAPRPVNVIVVARLVDTRLYVEAIEAGAFDFLAPPFTTADLAHVVRCAADNVLGRREAQGHADESAMGRLFPVVSAPAHASGRSYRSVTQTPPPHPTAKLA